MYTVTPPPHSAVRNNLAFSSAIYKNVQSFQGAMFLPSRAHPAGSPLLRVSVSFLPSLLASSQVKALALGWIW